MCAIEPGERYEQHAYLADGKWHHEKACAYCEKFAEECGSYDFDGLRTPCPSELYEIALEGGFVTELGAAFCARRALRRHDADRLIELWGGREVRP